ncbi:MAG: EAL domain-containing protein [Sphingopyxis sp.]
MDTDTELSGDKYRDNPKVSATTQGTTPAIEQDFVIGGITLSAILLFVGTGTSWLNSLVSITDIIGNNRGAVTATLLLNIALILFGWRRFRDLRAEVERRAKAERQASYLAMHDSLTGFLNRRAFAEMAAVKMKAWRDQGLVPAALVIDIDSFKSINDLFGHASGDQVILVTGQRIVECCPPDAIVARLGGDEFAILMPKSAGDTLMDDVGNILTHALAEPIAIDNNMAATSSSIGGAVASEADQSLDALLRHADSAMYSAKKLGRCRYERFNEDMSSALNQSDLVERELRQAITNDDIYPVYEPLIDLSTGDTIGYEMLARWDSVTLGVVHPSEFILVAETSGLIGTMASQLFRKAMLDAVQWPASLSLSVNVSPLQLRDPWFSQKLLHLLTETGFPSQRLIIELTESAIVDNVPFAKAVFTSLRNQGIRISLDDFGTGYSSVASLRELPFDSLKLDREYVTQMADEPGLSAIAEAVLHLGQSLGIPVIAEGIESVDIAQRLQGLSCAVGQGHYFSKSMSQEDIIRHHQLTTQDAAKSA